MKYHVIVKTGEQKDSGTDCAIKLKIIGSESETKFHLLDHFMHNDFERGSTETYTFDDNEIGDVECICLYVTQPSYDFSEPNWYIDYIIIATNDNSEDGSQKHGIQPNKFVSFPIYQWIVLADHGKKLFISTNKTCIPQKDSSVRTKDNLRIHQTKKESCRWSQFRFAEGFPGHIEHKGNTSLDWNIRFTDKKDRNFTRNVLAAKANTTWVNILSKLQAFDSFDSFQKFYQDLKGEQHPKWVSDDRWRKDEEFGRQTLNGVNPLDITRCRNLPNNFPVTSDHVIGSLSRGLSLEAEMEAGNIYIINHKILENITTGEYNGKKTELPAAMCLLYVRPDNELVPIAIQLGQHPGTNCPIWFPSDDPLDWLLAKIWFKNADIQVHQMKSHLALTHLLMEPFAVAMYRCLPPVHPIHKLLRENLQFVIAINTLGRNTLIQKVNITSIMF